MSLLMEALKKAEQAKQSADGSPVDNDALRLEPIDSGTAATEPAVAGAGGKELPELPAQLDVLDTEFMPHPDAAGKKHPKKPAAKEPAPSPRPAQPVTPVTASRAPVHTAAPPRPAAASTEGERKAAQQLFAAKQPERSRKGFAIAMGTMTVIGVAAIGGYFWWQLQPHSGQSPFGLAGNTPSPAAPPPAQMASAPAQPAAPQGPLQGGVTPAPTSAAVVASAASSPDDDAEDQAPAAPAPRRAAQRPPPPPEPEGPVRITKSRFKLNPGLAQGFESLNAGDLASAQNHYAQVLLKEPKNPDALHGLAAVALRQGNLAKAEEYWLQALEADPKDALAQAALINSGGRGSADPLAQESRLKTLIASQPEIAPLHFALGNVFARQNRWNEAQQAFFKAFSIEPEHPDYVFNLAVSLDHLRQARPAAQYYNLALAAANQRPAGFDKVQVTARLRELQP